MRAARLEAPGPSPRRARVQAAAAALMVAIVLTSLKAGPAHAQAFYGKAQVQFRRIETLRPGQPRFVSESWLQTYEINHSILFNRRTSVNSQFTYTQLSYLNRPDAVRSPFGRLRMQDPLFGLTASYKPIRTTSVFGDSAQAQEVTYRAEESRFDGYLLVPRGPQVTGSWVRVHRKEDVLTPGGTGTTRALRATQLLGPLSLRGGYSDRLRDPVPENQTRTVQRAWDGGAALNLAAGTRASIGLDYSYFLTERPFVDRAADRTRSHQATLQSSFAQSPHSNWNLFYVFRQSGVSNGLALTDISHDGSLLFTHRPTRAVALTAGGGLRSVRETSGFATQKYTSATASARGRIRPGWTADAGLSHTNNWVPDRAAYTQDGANVYSRLRVRNGLDLNGTLNVSTTSDTTVGTSRVTVQASYQAVFEPWRTFRFVFSDNHYNAGPRLFEIVSSSRSHTYDARWTPFPGFALRGVHSVTGTLPDQSQRFATTTWTMSYTPTQRLKLWTSYTRSDRQTGAGSDQITGREILSARVIAGVTPTVTVNGGATMADPDTPVEARQYDMSVTKTFGR